VPDLGAAEGVERPPKGVPMRTSKRISIALFSLTVFTLSCSVNSPATFEEPTPAVPEVDRIPSEALLRAEADEIARFLQDRNTGLLPAEVVHLSRVIVVEAHRAGLPPALVLAVIEVESGGRNFVTSKVGARGLMQLLPTTAAAVAAGSAVPWSGPETLFDPVANVRLGVRYLRELIDRYDSIPTGLAAYNWGPGRIGGRLRRGEPIPRRYADRVLAAWAGAGSEI
jgi:soluble lytic murein transglycosylase-like protein